MESISEEGCVFRLSSFFMGISPSPQSREFDRCSADRDSHPRWCAFVRLIRRYVFHGLHPSMDVRLVYELPSEIIDTCLGITMRH